MDVETAHDGNWLDVASKLGSHQPQHRLARNQADSLSGSAITGVQGAVITRSVVDDYRDVPVERLSEPTTTSQRALHPCDDTSGDVHHLLWARLGESMKL